ncbi:hypothetical protein D3C81_1173180 [compost metagenome]
MVLMNWPTKNGLPSVFAWTSPASGCRSRRRARSVSASSVPTASTSSGCSARWRSWGLPSGRASESSNASSSASSNPRVLPTISSGSGVVQSSRRASSCREEGSSHWKSSITNTSGRSGSPKVPTRLRIARSKCTAVSALSPRAGAGNGPVSAASAGAMLTAVRAYGPRPWLTRACQWRTRSSGWPRISMTSPWKASAMAA